MFPISRPFNRPVVWLLLLTGLIFLAGCAGSTVTTNWAGLSTDGEKVYLAFGPRVLAFDTATQEQAWIYPTEESQVAFYAAPSVQEGRVIFGDYGRAGGFFSPRVTTSIYALQENESGGVTELWTNAESATDKIVAPPLQVEDIVYVGTADNYVLALDAATGSERWNFEADHAIWGEPVYRDGMLYVASMDWSVYALDAETGQQEWATRLGGALPSRPVLGETLLYVSSFDGNVHALDIATGEQQWQAAATDWVWGAPALADDVLYFGDIQGNLFSVDAQTGEQLWTQPSESVVQTSPIYADGVLYIASDKSGETPAGALTAYDASNGQQIWSQPTSVPLYAAPVIVGDAVVVGLQNADSLLIGFDLVSGQELWRFALPQTSS